MLNAHSPACPGCGALITKVISTNIDEEGGHLIRRRHCQFCDARFYTGQPVEQIVDVKWQGHQRKQTVRITNIHDTPFRKPTAASGV